MIWSFLQCIIKCYESFVEVRGHSFSTYAKVSDKLTFLTPHPHPLIRIRRSSHHQGVKNVDFLENFVYVLNEWPLCQHVIFQLISKWPQFFWTQFVLEYKYFKFCQINKTNTFTYIYVYENVQTSCDFIKQTKLWE